MTWTTRSNLLFASVLLAGCVQTIVRPVPLPLVAHPVLPKVTRAEVQCLSDDVYTKIINRQNGYKTWGLALEAIIEKNNEKAKAPKP